MYNRFTSRHAWLMGFPTTYVGQYCLCIVNSRVFNTSMVKTLIMMLIGQFNCFFTVLAWARFSSASFFFNSWHTESCMVSLGEWYQYFRIIISLTEDILKSLWKVQSYCIVYLLFLWHILPGHTILLFLFLFLIFVTALLFPTNFEIWSLASHPVCCDTGSCL